MLDQEQKKTQPREELGLKIDRAEPVEPTMKLVWQSYRMLATYPIRAVRVKQMDTLRRMLFFIPAALVLLFWLHPPARVWLSPGPELVGRLVMLGLALWVVGIALQILVYGAVTTPFGG